MDIILGPLFGLADIVLGLYVWVVLAWVIMSWLISFNMINTTQPFIYQVSRLLYALTEPVLAPIRRIIPIMGGFDLSPIVLLLAVWFVRDVLRRLAFSLGV
jgi:YggT family protein